MWQLLTFALLAGSALAGDFTVKIVPRQNNQYPPGFAVPTVAQTPQAWTDALNAAVAAGKIPNIPVATLQNGNIVYPGSAGWDANTCSWTMTKCLGPNDVSNALPNMIGLAFDDGPTGNSGDLYDFLAQQNQSTTHFMIGSNIITYPDQFAQAVKLGNQHFAVHTWSHQPCSTLTNQQLIAELGWTMQVIADQSGGYIPKFWRPPQGDVDNRVRAIAEQIFGLTSVLWNADTNDWCLDDNGGSACPGTTLSTVTAAAQQGINGAKNPGLMMLEHELTHASIGVFKAYFPSLKGLGWIPSNIAESVNMQWYKNALSSSHTPINGTVLQTFDLSSNTVNTTTAANTTAANTTAANNTTSAPTASNKNTTIAANKNGTAQGSSTNSTTATNAKVGNTAAVAISTSFSMVGLSAIAAVVTALL